MKKICFSFIFSVIAALLFSASICASDNTNIVAEGMSGENISWKICNINSEEASKPHYQLYFEGEGELRGYTEDGSALGYGNYKKSQFGPWMDYLFEIYVGEGIEKIGSSGLGFFTNVAFIELPASVTSLGSCAFASNPLLERIMVKGNRPFLGADFSNITKIEHNVLDDCPSIRYIHLNPSYVGELYGECFGSCNSMESFTVPAGVTKLRNTFDGCKNLKELIFLGDPTLDNRVFEDGDTSSLTIYTETVGGNVDAFAKANGIPVIYSIPEHTNEFYSPDENVIDIGKCNDDVFYRIVKEGEGDRHTMYVFGPGSVMSTMSYSGDGVGYSSINKCYWYPYRNLVNKVVLSDNIVTMTSICCGFMSNLTHLEITENLTGITGACFEASSNFGCIYKRGDEPIEGHLDLTGIVNLGSYTYDACRGIKSAHFAENVSTTYLGVELFKNCVNLTSVKLPLNLKEVRKDAFLNCKKLESLIFYSDATIHPEAFRGCTALSSLAGIRNSSLHKYCEENGITFIEPNVISVYLDGTLLSEVDVVTSAFLYPQLIDGKICLLYRDEGCTEPYDYNERVYESFTLYAKELISFEGYMVRSEDYHGIRAIYNFNIDRIGGDSMYSVISLGSISSLERGVRGVADIKYSGRDIFKNPIVENGAIVGKLLGYPEGEVAKFAYTAKGYEKNGALDMKNATELLFFRPYALVENKMTGEIYEFYGEVTKTTLKDLCSEILEAEKDSMTDVEKSFIGAGADAEYNRDMLYTKEELMAYLEAVYADRDHVLYGQHIDIGSVNTLENKLASYKEVTGDYPAVVAVDQGTINGAKLTEEEKLIFRTDLVEYAKRGGIISISFHMDNPTDESLYYRGYLGKEAEFDALMTSGTETNASLMRSLETAAETLKFLEDAGIPVLWRPLHEMNGGWFWWCTVQKDSYVLDGEYVARLWRYYYNYFENECGLTNLIWVYSPNYSNNTSTSYGTQHVMHCYPGDEYVDLVGCDWYTGTGDYKEIDGAGKSYSSIVATGKPACITEFGPSGNLLPSLEGGEHPYSAVKQLSLMRGMVDDLGFSMVYFLNWSGKWSIYSFSDAADFMADPMIYGAKDSYRDLIESKMK